MNSLEISVFVEETSKYGAKISLKCSAKKLTKHFPRKSLKCGQRIVLFSSMEERLHYIIHNSALVMEFA